jgi:hypothetical protein
MHLRRTELIPDHVLVLILLIAVLVCCFGGHRQASCVELQGIDLYPGPVSI